MTIGALVLAAGQSRRFGTEDKLLAVRNGRPLVAASLRLTQRPGIAQRLAVVSSPAVAALAVGLGVVPLKIDPGQGQSASLRAGLVRLRDLGTTRLLVLLGDMPFVTPRDIDRILARPSDRPACASLDGVPMPPAVFPGSWFDRIAALDGDRGAGSLLRDLDPADLLPLPAASLRDIDLPDDLDGV